MNGFGHQCFSRNALTEDQDIAFTAGNFRQNVKDAADRRLLLMMSPTWERNNLWRRDVIMLRSRMLSTPPTILPSLSTSGAAQMLTDTLLPSVPLLVIDRFDSGFPVTCGGQLHMSLRRCWPGRLHCMVWMASEAGTPVNSFAVWLNEVFK
jgi:hypothetical protein